MRFAMHVGVLAAGFAGVACAAPQPTFEPVIVPVDLGAPRCCEGGPSVQILQTRRIRCGKGDECTLIDQRIRNPEDRPLWLLVDASSDFSGYLKSVSILHPRHAPGPPVWEFHGQSYHQAFRVPPGADIIVRNVEYRGLLTKFRAVFFDSIALNYDRHIDRLTSAGVMPARGDFEMQWLRRSEYESKELFPLEGRERVSLGKWCEQTVPVSEEPSNPVAADGLAPHR